MPGLDKVRSFWKRGERVSYCRGLGRGRGASGEGVGDLLF